MTQALLTLVAARNRAMRLVDAMPAAGKVALAVVCAAVTGLSARLAVPLPFTPVPLTGQVFAVLFSGILLGSGYGALSQALYLSAGIAGAGCFASASAGFPGATFGYLVGFIPAAAIMGATARRGGNGIVPWFVGPFAAIEAIHLCGIAWLAPFLRVGPAHAFIIGSLPFLVPDLLKAYLAVLAGRALRGATPETSPVGGRP